MARAHVPLAMAVALAALFAGCAKEAAESRHGGHEDPGVCATCHMTDYREAHHDPRERPPMCPICHTQNAWRPSVKHHPWPLTGAHDKAKCLSCHTGTPPVFHGTSKACFDCHRADYEKENARHPAHAKRPHTCETCHDTTSFKDQAPQATDEDDDEASSDAGAGAESPPDAATPIAATSGAKAAPASPSDTGAPRHPEKRFPIKTGDHATIDCKTCHDRGGKNGKGNTDCVQCHERAEFDERHEDVEAYPKGAAAPNFCVNCHTHGTRAHT